MGFSQRIDTTLNLTEVKRILVKENLGQLLDTSSPPALYGSGPPEETCGPLLLIGRQNLITNYGHLPYWQDLT